MPIKRESMYNFSPETLKKQRREKISSDNSDRELTSRWLYLQQPDNFRDHRQEQSKFPATRSIVTRARASNLAHLRLFARVLIRATFTTSNSILRTCQLVDSMPSHCSRVLSTL